MEGKRWSKDGIMILDELVLFIWMVYRKKKK